MALHLQPTAGIDGDEYQSFLEAKMPLAQPAGLPCDLSEVARTLPTAAR